MNRIVAAPLWELRPYDLKRLDMMNIRLSTLLCAFDCKPTREKSKNRQISNDATPIKLFFFQLQCQSEEDVSVKIHVMDKLTWKSCQGQSKTCILGVLSFQAPQVLSPANASWFGSKQQGRSSCKLLQGTHPCMAVSLKQRIPAPLDDCCPFEVSFC
jgi:hypothetical protein